MDLKRCAGFHPRQVGMPGRKKNRSKTKNWEKIQACSNKWSSLHGRRINGLVFAYRKIPVGE